MNDLMVCPVLSVVYMSLYCLAAYLIGPFGDNKVET